MDIPMPTGVDDISDLTGRLDNATHDQRMAWAYKLGEKEQKRLYDLADGTALKLDDIVLDEEVFIHPGRNGLPLFNRFEKRFARLGERVVGYNHNDAIGGPLNFIAKRVTGPGHFTAYACPEGRNEVWIDYRMLPKAAHPEFPPLADNDTGLRSLVFGNMVDVLRRVSTHVLIGDAFKDKSPATTFGSRIGALFPTAPFVLVQPPRSVS